MLLLYQSDRPDSTFAGDRSPLRIDRADASPFHRLRLAHRRRLYKGLKEGMRPVGTRPKLRMKLAADKPRVIFDLDHFHLGAVGGESGEDEPVLFKERTVPHVHLVPVAVALRDGGRAVDASRLAPLRQYAGLEPQPHGAAQLGPIV